MPRKSGKMKRIYYIGVNAGNAIGNEEFFEGSITVYPTNERGNIFFCDKSVENIESDEFMQKYKEFVATNISSIQKQHEECEFISFNPKIQNFLKELPDLNVVEGTRKEIIDFLNDKFAVRDFVKNCVPVLDYIQDDGDKLEYECIKDKLSCGKFVVQARTGAGGNGTYFIDSEASMNRVCDKKAKYCVSRYEPHIPFNITLVVGKYNTVFLPLSAQLISKKDGTFKYVGGDFIYPQTLTDDVKNQIRSYSEKIYEKVKKLGYRGILGIDYILCEDGRIRFMEINPRFQSSSFLLSDALKRECGTSVAELHYMAITDERLPAMEQLNINSSFLNCSLAERFDCFDSPHIIYNGYFAPNLSSVYRKVFDYSILMNGNFEKLPERVALKDLHGIINSNTVVKVSDCKGIKICLVSEEYPEETNFGGIATYQKRMAVALTKLGHHVTVITRALREEREYTEDGVDVVRILKGDTGNILKDYTDYRMCVCDTLNRLIEKNKVDIIEVPDWGAEAIFFARQKNVPMIVKMHTPLCIWSEFNKNGLGKGVHQEMLKWEKESVERADKVISCTEILKDMLYPAMQINRNIPIEVIANPANIEDFYPINGCHKSKNILYCGSLEQRKGVDILARAIPIVLRCLRDSGVKFVFVGKDTTRNDENISMIEYIKKIVPEEYHRNLKFLGQLNNSELNPIYNDARIGIIPSMFDNLPYVAMEEMLTEMPIIASRNTGVREMISDGVSGLLYEPQDYNELSDRIVYMYTNPEVALRMGRAARKAALIKYTPQTIAKTMERIYTAEIKKFKAKSRLHIDCELKK